jgi:predicted transcriptional regulator
MHLRLLFEELDKADATTRIFLIKFLQRFGFSGLINLRIKDFVKELGIHDKGVRSSLAFLEKHQYLQVSHIESKNRGRPKRAIVVGQRLIMSLDEAQGQRPLHADLIDKLLMEHLSWRDDGDKKQAVGLKNSERLLMAVLYAHADSDGRVVGLGFGTLSSCTGLNESQLRAHIRILKSQGCIRNYKSGGFIRDGSRQICSEYLLNLNDESKRTIGEETVSVEALGLFERSALLAYALVVVKGAPFAVKAANGFYAVPIMERQQWLSSYQLPEDWYVELEKCLRFFEGRDIHGRKLENMCRLLCNVVACLLMMDKESRSLDVIGELLRQRKELAFNAKKLTSQENHAVILFFSKVIKAFLSEIEPQLGDEISFGLDQCSIWIGGRDSLKISYRVKSDGQEQE